MFLLSVSCTVVINFFKSVTNAGNGLSFGGASMVHRYRIALYLPKVSVLAAGLLVVVVAAGFWLSSSGVVVVVVVGVGVLLVVVVVVGVIEVLVSDTLVFSAYVSFVFGASVSVVVVDFSVLDNSGGSLSLAEGEFTVA